MCKEEARGERRVSCVCAHHPLMTATGLLELGDAGLERAILALQGGHHLERSNVRRAQLNGSAHTTRHTAVLNKRENALG